MAKIKKIEELVKLPFKDLAVSLMAVTKSLMIGSAQFIGMIQNVRRNKTKKGKMRLKIKLPKSPKGIENNETFSPKKRARISWVENNP